MFAATDFTRRFLASTRHQPPLEVFEPDPIPPHQTLRCVRLLRGARVHAACFVCLRCSFGWGVLAWPRVRRLLAFQLMLSLSPAAAPAGALRVHYCYLLLPLSCFCDCGGGITAAAAAVAACCCSCSWPRQRRGASFSHSLVLLLPRCRRRSGACHPPTPPPPVSQENQPRCRRSLPFSSRLTQNVFHRGCRFTGAKSTQEQTTSGCAGATCTPTTRSPGLSARTGWLEAVEASAPGDRGGLLRPRVTPEASPPRRGEP